MIADLPVEFFVDPLERVAPAVQHGVLIELDESYGVCVYSAGVGDEDTAELLARVLAKLRGL